MKKQIVLASVLTVLSLPSFASSFYVSGNFGQSKFTVDGASGSESDTAYSFGAGYKFNANWAAEVNFRDFGGFGYSYNENLGGGDYFSESMDFSFSSLEISIVGSYPLNDTTSVYGRLGFGDLELDVDYKVAISIDGDLERDSDSESDSKNKSVFGFGLRHNFTEAVGARLEYNQYDDWEGLEVSVTTIGLVYQF